MATFNSLPTELVSMIFQQLRDLDPSQRLAPYTILSRTWQHLIEPYTFASLKTSTEDLPTLKRLITEHRRNFVRKLDHSVTLPTYGPAVRYGLVPFEPLEEEAANSVMFSDGVQLLFEVLAGWNGARSDLDGHCLHLILSAISPTEQQDPLFGSLCDRSHKRWRHTLLYLVPGLELPVVDSVTVFSHTSSYIAATARNISGACLAKMAGKFPALAKIDWLVADMENMMFPDRRVKQRKEFGEELLKAADTFKALKHVSFSLANCGITNHYFQPPQLHASSEPDILSLAITKVLQLPQLTKIFLNGILLPASFFAHFNQHCFQNLTSLTVMTGSYTPDGHRYLAHRAGTLHTQAPLPSFTYPLSPMAHDDPIAMEYNSAYNCAMGNVREKASIGPPNYINTDRLGTLLAGFAKMVAETPKMQKAFFWMPTGEDMWLKVGYDGVERGWEVMFPRPSPYRNDMPLEGELPREFTRICEESGTLKIDR
ncbi:hypothetical protein BJ508DRAFT_413200 [Ascobolus immersus RN42]|uniref:F-box domain-containing protein n=1 Tax=Ascobolus immersus RN42 TaxID=1160509 RepID=A0A3N4IGQ9_ASCIM|nr:hypothetical protein BJ508DRAFT_413200 [Ascobolus immersus RN42]